MKPVNWISATGFNPLAAMPIATPAIAVWAGGVSRTRSGPKRRSSPTVARNTPPFPPTSSPTTTTDSSRVSSRASARFTASMRFTSAMIWTWIWGTGHIRFRVVTWIWGTGHIRLRAVTCPQADRLRALLLQCVGQRRVEVIEHVLGRRGRRGLIGIDRLGDFVGALARERLLALLVPDALARHVVAQARDGLDFPRGVHALGIAVARRIVRGRVVAQPIADRLDERRPAAGARLLERLGDDVAHGDHVVPVHLPSLEARGDRLLGESLRRRLTRARH